jgi:membrane-associated phospholipid phosphatase
MHLASDWTVWDFTAAVYSRRDPMSFAMSLVTLTPQALILVLGTLVIATAPNKKVALICSCLAASEAVNFVLKRAIGQDRPRHPFEHGRQVTYGMPSSHAQFVACGAAAAAVLLWKGQGWLRAAKCGACGVLALLVAASRVYNHFHSAEQVAAGLVLGTVLGATLSRAQWLRYLTDTFALPLTVLAKKIAA